MQFHPAHKNDCILSTAAAIGSKAPAATAKEKLLKVNTRVQPKNKVTPILVSTTSKPTAAPAKMEKEKTPGTGSEIHVMSSESSARRSSNRGLMTAGISSEDMGIDGILAKEEQR